ncbi:MAG: hypothetical protein KDK99_07825 [Verrucomicrobiales bacterium]|nr:hypothetical protein [Verrucomicrobiales bacterium]
MENITFPEAVRRASARDARYRPEAYEVVRAALGKAAELFCKDAEDQHVTGQQLLEGFRRLVLEEYGPMSLTLLEMWGLHEGGDVGNVVYNLIEEKYFGRRDEDSIEDFHGGYDFRVAFTEPFLPSSRPSSPASDPA